MTSRKRRGPLAAEIVGKCLKTARKGLPKPLKNPRKNGLQHPGSANGFSAKNGPHLPFRKNDEKARVF